MRASIWTRQPNNEEDDNANDNKNNPKTKTFLVYLHGNASARVEVLPQLSFLLATGIYGVCSLDFTGSGHSDGDYVSLGYYERYDLECMLQYLQQTYGNNTDSEASLEVVLWGRSMGASTALMHASEKTRDSIMERTQQHETFPDGTPLALQYDPKSSNAILKGLICDSPFSSLPKLCEELVDKARAQGIVEPGVVVSVAIAMIARSVRGMAHFSIRDIEPIEHVSTIDTPALFVVGAEDDFIPPHHCEELCEAYQSGISTNLLMVPGGHNDARPYIVFEAVHQFLHARLSLSEDMTLDVPTNMVDYLHRQPPWGFVKFGKHVFETISMRRSSSSTATLTTVSSSTTDGSSNALNADTVAHDFGMTQERQDDIQNKLHLMMGQERKQQQPQQRSQSTTTSQQQQPQRPPPIQTMVIDGQVIEMGVPMDGAPPASNNMMRDQPPPSSMRSQVGEEVDLIDFGGGPTEPQPSSMRSQVGEEVNLIDLGGDVFDNTTAD